MKKTVIKISGNELLSIDDSDVYHCYCDLLWTASERKNGQYQGIDTSNERNTTRIRINAGYKDESVLADKAVADAFGNRFYITLDFELLESHMSFCMSALGDRLDNELTFNDYNRVIQAADRGASCEIGNICLEYDMVTLPELAQMINNQYRSRISILYDRVLRHRKIGKDKSDNLWNINLNVPARSMKGTLMLFEDKAAQVPFARDTETFYNPKICKVEVTIEGIPNQLFSQRMRSYQMFDEARKLFPAGSKRHPEVATVEKDLALADAPLQNTSPASTRCSLTSGQAATVGSMAPADGYRMPAKVLPSR